MPPRRSFPSNRGDEDPRRDLIFGRGANSVLGLVELQKRLNARIEEARGKAIPHWTPHDLRRTFATYAGGGLPEQPATRCCRPQEREAAGGLGEQPHVIEAVLNHVSGHKAGVAGIYNRSSYAREKKVALDNGPIG